MSRAKIAILLVSADFLASDYVDQYELPSLSRCRTQRRSRNLVRHRQPVGVCANKELSQFQAVNDPRHPLNSMPESEQEAVFEKVAGEVEQIMGQQELRPALR